MTDIERKFRFRSFRIYKDARLFICEIKEIINENFPPDERFALRAQLWRALYSILLKIAEGSDRGSDRDFAKFLNNAHTSLNEVVACWDIALDSNYINNEIHIKYIDKAAVIADQLTAFRRSLLLSSKGIYEKP